MEIYDADGGAPANRLVNISARANVGTGDNILIGGNTSWLEPVTRGGSPVSAGVEPATARVMSRVGAFLLPEPQMTGYQAGWGSAVILTLPPGAYTACVSSADGAGGIALVEIYEVR